MCVDDPVGNVEEVFAEITDLIACLGVCIVPGFFAITCANKGRLASGVPTGLEVAETVANHV